MKDLFGTITPMTELSGSVNTVPEVPVEGFTVNETLRFENGVLSVNTANVVEKNNILPVTSAAVHVVVGNIDVLLGTI